MPPIEGPSSHTIAPNAAAAIRETIAEADGAEVFFVGRRGEDGLVHEVESYAYGTKSAVPVILDRVKPGEVLIHNHPSGHLAPSEADLDVSSRIGQIGAGSYICDNGCERIRIVVKPHDAQKKTPVDPARIRKMLGPESALATMLGDYEDRPQQREMATAVVDALNTDGIAVVEAGTGTGKSLAYLIPAVFYALQNKERVVVSTRTINLQEQILHKDLPLVAQALEREIKAELVKGRGNYVCKRKAQMARDELGSGQMTLIEDQQVSELRDTLDWAAASPTGDVSELSIPPQHDVWERVVSEADNCLRVRCPFYNECFFYNSRRRAARADVLVVNHSLLMSDLAVRRESNNWSAAAVLPPYQRVVLDEAHHLEDVATSHLGFRVTRPNLARLFHRLYRRDSRSRKGVYAGLADKLEDLRQRSQLPPDSRLLNVLAVRILPSVADVRGQIDHLMEDFGYYFLEAARLKPPHGKGEVKARLTPDLTKLDVWQNNCRPALHAIGKEISEFTEINREAMACLEDLEEELLNELTNLILEWRAIVERLEAQRRLILDFLQDDERQCRWVEMAEDRRRNLSVRLCLAPVSVAQVLGESLHQRMKSEVLTSATLTVDEDFRFFTGRTGVGAPSVQPAGVREPGEDDDDAGAGLPFARPVRTLKLSTPFDYSQQVFLGVPNDLGVPKNIDFERRLAALIPRAVEASDGRAFVLFTSYAQMDRVFRACSGEIHRMGYRVLKQGTENRDLLLRRFRDDETSVLFATSSFWEGVDVKGRSLELLILVKLPFAVPDDPVQQAQWEYLEKLGLDPFVHLAVPRAIIRFKQGFGRLIRSRTDRGGVLVCDERLVKMNYGQRFLRSLPKIPVQVGRGEELVDELRQFLQDRAALRQCNVTEGDVPF
ncbi:MAG: helicase C-terminal domain-containing protein [Sumerlaeia bacterium]